MAGTLMGCGVPEGTWLAWERILVSDREPLFVTGATASLLPPGTLVLNRDELSAWPLDFRDSYWTHAVAEEARWVALLTPTEWRRVGLEHRQALRLQQWRLGRGQLYDWSFACDILRQTPKALRRLESEVFDADGTPMIDLTFDIWRAMPREARRAWLARYVGSIASAGDPECLSSTLSAGFWREAEAKGCGPAVRRLAGTFATHSGPNCFATVLAGLTDTLEAGLSMASLWLWGDPFLRNLRARGFSRQEGALDPCRTGAGDVVIWEDDDGHMVHAALCLGTGLVLNKNAQGWARPRQVLRLTDVMRDWAAGGHPAAWVHP